MVKKLSICNIILFFNIFLLSLLSPLCFSQPGTSGWFYQPLPIPTDAQIRDLRFFDENTGLVVTGNPFYILRTTNGGYNWQVVINNQYISLIDIIDSNAVYGAGAFSNGHKQIIRSYNRGLTWDSIAVNVVEQIYGISFVNRDTGWIGGTAAGLPYICRTTNGGLSWTVQSDDTGYGKLFFLKQKLNGFYIGWSQQESVATYKTTNSGINWFQIENIGAVSKIYFLNQYTGFAANYNTIRKTTNGGLNWSIYYLPSDSGIVFNTINLFVIINNNTIYGDNGVRYLGGGKYRGVIWVSTNGGINWGFQQPDTTIERNRYYGIDFANKDTGWSSWIRTNNGGGQIIISGVNSFITSKPELFSLEQNYPNPFNASTRINFSLPKAAFISLCIYDITGKELFRIFDKQLFSSGYYFTIIDLSKTNLSSGVYYYRLTALDFQENNLFAQSKKFVFIK